MEADHQYTVEPSSLAGPAGRPGPATANRPGPVGYDAEEVRKAAHRRLAFG
jgi:hypothetical protein